MQYPLVSAIVLCYNHARFVIECLESVKAQQYPNLELIVHDDASGDESAALIQAWLARCDIPGRFLGRTTNQGLCRSLNYALSYSAGKYISGIAADDVWLPGKLLRQVELMERLPGRVGVVYSDAFQMDEEGKPLSDKFIEAHRRFKTMPEGNIQNILWEGNFIPAMTTLIRSDCYRQAGPFDETLFYEDWDMWLRISRSFDFVYSPEISARYRFVPTSMARSQRARMLDASCQICLKHLNQGELSRDARRLAMRKLFEFTVTSVRERTPGRQRNFLKTMRLVLADTLAFALLWRFLNQKIARNVFRRQTKPV
ncbi:MAG TPA: glycosyltransferase [Verrucomicrobiae bacterium]|nr:glycosyltransferase [Verrucomicrobiae bacterium]